MPDCGKTLLQCVKVSVNVRMHTHTHTHTHACVNVYIGKLMLIQYLCDSNIRELKAMRCEQE